MEDGSCVCVCVSMSGLRWMTFERQKAGCRYERMICVCCVCDVYKNGGLWDEIVV